jgi:hypothetical protein
MIGGGPNAARPVSAATQARMVRFELCGADIAVLDTEAGLQLVSLWQFEADATPRITANRFVTDQTAVELRALADHLDAVLAKGSAA